jgi:tetratricopeptide (TPR) repeat protein
MQSIDPSDQAQVAALVNAIALNDRTFTVFAVAPDSSPLHPVVVEFQARLQDELGEPVQFSTLHYSDDSLFDFLRRTAGGERVGRQVVMIFGLEQLPEPKLKREMEQLNLGRERIFEHDLVLVFWLNREAFLDEFRRRAADFWDWRGNVMTFVTCPPTEQLLYPYLEWLIAENSYLKMSGVMQVNRQVDISLDQIYVSLQAEWVEERSQSFRERVSPGVSRSRSRRDSEMGEPDSFEDEFRDEPLMEMSAEPASRQRVTKMMDVAEAVRQREYGVILGDPGAGKTTLLRYLARHFAIAHREGRSTVIGGTGEDLGGARLPILFRIADFAEKLVLEPELGLVEYLRRFYRQWEDSGCGVGDGDAVAELLLSKMVTGDCLLLLDGLDEVLDGEYRGRVVRAIDRLVSDYPSNKFVITSRIAGYQEASLGSRFREFTITPMGNEQIKNFLGRWCLAIEKGQRPEEEESLQVRDAERESAGIFHAIETKPGVKRFAANPLLLTILALIHRNGTQMPQRRVELYELATKTLIEDWQLGRVASYRVATKQLTLVDEQVTELLAPLAFRMHDEKSSGVVTQAELEEWLVPLMENSQGVEAEEALALVREFLRKVRETTGLFVERGPGVYGFMHLTFEEYYAARHIADNDVSDILAMIRPYLYEARWNEPILLALGYLSSDRKQVNRLLELLFVGLVEYQPIVVGQEIRLKNATSDPVLVWHSPSGVQESAEVWKDLLFVGQVLAEVKVAPKFCRQQVDKLVLTYLGLDEGYGKESIQQLLRLFRGIESFNGQVLERLQKSAIDEQLSEEQRDQTLVAILYVVCGEAGDLLIDRITEIVQELTPSLFNEIRNFMEALGLEMTPSLERTLEDFNLDAERRRSLDFITGLSYLRSENYDRAIEHLQPLADQADCHLDGFIDWAIAIAHEKKEEHEQGLKYYQQCLDKFESTQSWILWRNRGACYRSHKEYNQSLECFQQAITIARELSRRKAESTLLWNIGITYHEWGKHKHAVEYYEKCLKIEKELNLNNDIIGSLHGISSCYKDWGRYQKAIEFQQKCLELKKLEEDKSQVAGSFYEFGRIYQTWGKYAASIEQYQQSLDLYQELEKTKDVANLWYWIGDCYKDWSKYEKAIDCQQQCLKLRQLEEDKSSIALSFYELGRIYQVWKKYEDAIDKYQQSYDLYQQLEKKKDVSNQCYWIGDCYKDWKKYKKAIESQQQCLELRRLEEDESRVSLSLYQLGRIYQTWGKYEEAIEYYQQSRDTDQQLEKKKDVATMWFWIGDCYKAWEKYGKAIECQQQCLELRRLEDESRVTLALYQIGVIYQAWGKYEEAIVYYQQSRDIYYQLENEASTATQWYNIAGCYRLWSKYDLALESVQQCIAIRQKLDDQSGLASCYFQIGYIYQIWEKYEEAIDYYQQSRDLYHQLENESNTASQWHNIAACYRLWSKYNLGLEAVQQCIAIRQKLDDQSGLASCYFQIGYIYQVWEKYEEAIEHYQESHNLYQKLEEEKDVADLLYQIADCYRDWGKYEKALKAEQQDLAIRQKLDDQSRVALSYLQFGRIYQASGKYEEAIEYHQKSREISQQIEKEGTVANRWDWIASCYREWGKHELAFKAEEQNLSILQKLDDQTGIANAYFQIGYINQDWGKYEEAIDYYQRSRDLHQKLGKEKNTADLCYSIADCYRQWNKYTEALKSSRQYLIGYQKLDNQSEIAIAYRQFGRIYQTCENYTEAIEYHQQSLELYQQLDKAKNIATQFRCIAHNQSKLAQQTADRPSALILLNQAEQNLQQAIQLNTENEYQENLAYDHISLSLLQADRLRHHQTPTLIHQFETTYTIGLTTLLALGQTVNHAQETLDIARAYLEIPALQNFPLAETLTHQSLQTFQTYNRRKLQAKAHQLLGQIHQANSQPEAATQALQQSRQLYQDLDLPTRVAEIDRLLSQPSSPEAIE